MAVNEAKLINEGLVDHADCEECLEDYLFLMQDSHHEFSIGLRTVLACLAFAEREGAIPPLPETWWCKINTHFH